MDGWLSLKNLKVPHNRLESPEGGRGVALHSLDLGARRGWVVSTTPRPLYPRERPCTYCTGGWVGPRAGLNVCEKSRPYRDSIPGLSCPQPVSIPTELPHRLFEDFAKNILSPKGLCGHKQKFEKHNPKAKLKLSWDRASLHFGILQSTNASH
jgi:hypothetical protein